jgi:PIN domain nuclease of toxin-antitoxin system
VRLLLDTHVILWWLANEPGLAVEARSEIAQSEAAFVSTASAWEISIKMKLGHLDAPHDLADHIARQAFTVLPIHLEHALQAGGLPWHHRDPFDRMLVAQARLENLTIVTRDPDISRYDVAVLAA